MPFALDNEPNGTMTNSTMEESVTVLATPSGPRAVILNTENTIRSTFFGYIDRREWTNLLNSYNNFNNPTRAAATTLANQYNQQARKNTLFTAMNAMASAAQQQNQVLCRFKTQATLNAIDDFLDNVGS